MRVDGTIRWHDDPQTRRRCRGSWNGRISWAEQDGSRHHATGSDLYGTEELPGWLARELVTHDDRNERDRDAWPWDPSRPIAGQYEQLIRAPLTDAERAEVTRFHRRLRDAGVYVDGARA